jgi:hypothetical protein
VTAVHRPTKEDSMLFTEDDDQQAEPQDVSRFQAFVRSAARAPGMRPGRTWLATITATPAREAPALATGPVASPA